MTAPSDTVRKTPQAAARIAMVAGILIVLGLLGWRVGYWLSPQPFHLIDLTPYYTAGTTNSTVNPFTLFDQNNLAALPLGKHRFGEVPFTVGGVLQLRNRDYKTWKTKFPESVAGIQIGAPCRLLHLLHGTGFITKTNDTPIARLVLHYEDGETAELFILYGRHVKDWWFQKESNASLDPGTEVAWRGSNPAAASQNHQLRIYRSSFSNPHPAKRIATIDYVSTLSACAPFILGMTLEK